jgi:CRISPR/Cas system-associated protein Csm6
MMKKMRKHLFVFGYIYGCVVVYMIQEKVSDWILIPLVIVVSALAAWIEEKS